MQQSDVNNYSVSRIRDANSCNNVSEFPFDFKIKHLGKKSTP